MIDIEKVQNITDIIHGTIQCNGFEKEIISTPIFNRLHRILQNSLVYLTFPSNKVKRFEHSLGTMHLAGKIFYNSILNAEQNDLNYFFIEIAKELKKWYLNIDDTHYSYLKKSCFDSVHGELADISRIPKQKSRFYNSYTPSNIDEKSVMYYIVVFQAIRIAGLLHDIGHLPYSHILEKSFAKLYREISAKTDRNPNEESYIEILKSYYENKQNKDAHIHEIISEKLFSILERCIADECGTNNSGDFCIIPVSFYIAKRIITSKDTENNIFCDLHRIISGTCDADRLDYCSRDLFCSGVNKDIINYERILNTFTLV